MNSDTKFCIVGAGAAGLSAARALREKGYKNITVFEKNNKAGGKCHTFEYEGRSYDLCAAVSRYT